MDKGKIEKLLQGRKIIDTHTATKEAAAGSKDYDIVHTDSILLMNSELQKLGFEEGNEVDSFLKFNKQMHDDILLEVFPLQGFCDGCVGNLDPTTGKETGYMCEKMYGKSCPDPSVLATKETGIIPMFLQMSVFTITRKNISDPNSKTISEKNHILRNACPEGHGFYVDISRVGDLPFDPWWEISNYFTPVATDEEKIALREKYPVKVSAETGTKKEL